MNPAGILRLRRGCALVERARSPRGAGSVARAVAVCGLVAAGIGVAGIGVAGAQEHDHEAERGTGPPALGHRPGPRALAMGDAVWAAGRSDVAIFHHPALLGGSGFGLAYAHLGERGSFVAASASGGWFGGTAGIGLSFVDAARRGGAAPSESPEHHGERGRSAAGDPSGEHGARGGSDGEEGSSFALAAGFAGELLGVRVGGAAKVVGQSMAAGRHATVALDLGAAAEAGPIALALSAQNLGPSLETGDARLPLPARLALGAGMDREPVGPFDIGAAVHAAVERDAGFSAGGGVEVAWWPVAGRVLAARAGVVSGRGEHGAAITFGAGFEGDRIRLDYAYGEPGRHEGQHAASISFR